MLEIKQTSQIQTVDVTSVNTEAEINVEMDISDLTHQIITYVTQIENMLKSIKQYVDTYIDLDLSIPTKISELTDDIGVNSFMQRINNASTLQDFGITDSVTYEEIADSE